MARFIELPIPLPAGPHTCLFTGAALGADTAVEHTILRGLGGRIRSRIVTSSDFNNRSGGSIDPFLVLLYGEIIRILGPLLATEHQAGNLVVEVPGETWTFVLDPQGGLTIRGTATQRDPITHQVTSIVTRPEDAAEAIAHHAAGRPYTQTTIPATTAQNWYRTRPLVLPPLEVCALKCGLLTFDHLLAGHPDKRFTRFRMLDSVCKYVREFVELREVDPAPMHYHSLGMQYGKITRLETIRDQLPVPRSPFEHVLIASGDSRRRRIDLIWSVFGFDPFGFRLTRAYDGEDFTVAVVNRPLIAGGGVSGPFWKSQAEAICVPTNLRSYPIAMTDAINHDLVHQITGRRRLAIQQAIDLVERSAPQMLVERLKNEASINRTGNHTLEAAVRNRLDQLFARRITTEQHLREFTDIVDEGLNRLPGADLGADITIDAVAARVKWSSCISAYHFVLDKLRPRFGFPGDVFLNTTVWQTMAAEVRNLRDIPLTL